MLHRKRAKSAQAKKELSAIAHDGRVTGIMPSPNGLYWLTAGTDNRLRLWDSEHHRHLLVNYPQTFNSSMKVRMAGSDLAALHTAGLCACLILRLYKCIGEMHMLGSMSTRYMFGAT